MKAILLILCCLPSITWAQSAQQIEYLLVAEIATDSCYQLLTPSETSFQDLEVCGFADCRDLISYSLRLVEAAESQVELAISESKKTFKLAKKQRCLQTREKCRIAIENLRLARMEIEEARQQILLIERQWLVVNESRSVSDLNASLEYSWVNSPRSYYVNTARLAILNTYDYLQIARLAIQEAQLTDCE
ncbi:MAG: hypothetical protein AAFP02_09790 [Bacteroidota bacterium]